ncbi:substrate-binding periplasmic protein [Undibacterium luofuense]|uniref:substrate-binding periplasmic protein n=1 Tax=Undibacterium luofuense TaxID=2828733 RepID=UPI0030EB655A
MMKNTIRKAGFLMLWLCSAAAQAETQKVTLFLSAQHDRVNPAAALSTPNRELLAFIESETGVQFERKFVPWKRALQSAIEGKGFVFGASQTPERLQHLVFSEPIYIDNVWIVTRCDTRFSFNSIGDLKGKTIGMIRDAYYGPEIAKAVNFVFTPEYDVNDSISRFDKLLKYRTDGLLMYTQLTDPRALEDLVNMQYGRLASQENPVFRERPFCAQGKPVHSSSLHFAVAPGYNDAYLKELNKALIKAAKTGRLAKWYIQPAAKQ